jgi:hypothetical protein
MNNLFQSYILVFISIGFMMSFILHTISFYLHMYNSRREIDRIKNLYHKLNGSKKNEII